MRARSKIASCVDCTAYWLDPCQTWSTRRSWQGKVCQKAIWWDQPSREAQRPIRFCLSLIIRTHRQGQIQRLINWRPRRLTKRPRKASTPCCRRVCSILASVLETFWCPLQTSVRSANCPTLRKIRRTWRFFSKTYQATFWSLSRIVSWRRLTRRRSKMFSGTQRPTKWPSDSTSRFWQKMSAKEKS